MNGSAIMKFAVRAIEQATNTVLSNSNLTMDDIKYIVPHQANIRIIESAAKGLGISMDKMVLNIKLNGNISSASIPAALDVMDKNNMLSKGDNIVLVGFGGGLTWAAAVIKWNK